MRMRIAGYQPSSLQKDATLTVGWAPKKSTCGNVKKFAGKPGIYRTSNQLEGNQQ